MTQLLRNALGAGEMAQSVTCLLEIHGDLCLNPQHPCKSPVWWHMYPSNHSTVSRQIQGAGGFQELTGHPACLLSSGLSERLCFKKLRWNMIEVTNVSLWYTNKHTHKCPYTHRKRERQADRERQKHTDTQRQGQGEDMFRFSTCS